MTGHGGVIIQGTPTVLIDELPAARTGDMTVCPVTPPAGPPPPHVGGPIVMGSSVVFIEGQPAARVGDLAQCVGDGPAPIVTGSGVVFVE